MHFIELLTCIILLLPAHKADKCVPPSQARLPYTFNYTVLNSNIPEEGLQWQVAGPSKFFVNLWTCHASKSECDEPPVNFLPNVYHAANMTDFGNGYKRSFFSIYPAISYDGFWVQWALGSQAIGSCQLEVYDFKSMPSCDMPYLEVQDINDVHVIVNCHISNVYPVPKCDFQVSENGQVMKEESTYSTENSGYHDRQCTMTTPVRDLIPKEYTFQVLMYPDVTNGNDYGKTATSPPIDLSLPKPTCEDPRLTVNKHDVIVTCSITSVFTGFVCNFKKQTNAGNFELVGLQSQSTLSSCSNSPQVNCNSQCTLTMSVSLLGDGIQGFKVSMSKNGYTTESDSTTSIQLWYPSTRIVNCPNGDNDYVKQGNTGTCGCEMFEPGNPPGRAQWMLSNNTEVGQVVNDTLSILTVTYDPQDPEPKYYCQGASLLSPGHGPNKTFRPKFAYTLSCPCGWIKIPGAKRCFRVYKERKTWSDAMKFCQARGGTLIKINDYQTDFFIPYYVKNEIKEDIWIGVSERPQDTTVDTKETDTPNEHCPYLKAWLSPSRCQENLCGVRKKFACELL